MYIITADTSYVDATDEIFQHFYPQLIELFPIDDVILLSELFLLVGLSKDNVKSEDMHKQTHFQESVIKPSVTLTELYQLFIVTTIQKQIKDDDKPTHLVNSEVEKILCEMLKGIPKQAVDTVFCLSRLAYCGFFDWFSKKNDCRIPKTMYTVDNLMQCGVQVTDCFYDLLKVVNTDQLPTDSVTFSFAHFTIQDFMCALYLATLPQEAQECLMKETFTYHQNIFVFWSGLTRLVFDAAKLFIGDRLQSSCDVATAVQCVYESRQTNLATQCEPFCLGISEHTLSSYDCLAISSVLSLYPISELEMSESQICDVGAEMLVKHYPDENSGHYLERLYFTSNHISLNGARALAKIVKKSRSLY